MSSTMLLSTHSTTFGNITARVFWKFFWAVFVTGTTLGDVGNLQAEFKFK